MDLHKDKQKNEQQNITKIHSLFLGEAGRSRAADCESRLDFSVCQVTVLSCVK